MAKHCNTVNHLQNVILTLTLVRSCQTRVLDSYTFLHLQVKLMFFVQFLSSSSPMCFFLRFAVWPPPVFPVLRLFPVLVWTLRSTQPVAHRSLRIAETADRGQDGKKPASLIADTTTANAQVRSLSAQAPLIARGNHRGRGRAEGRTTESLHGRESGGHRFWQESGQFRWIKSLFRSWKILNRT